MIICPRCGNAQARVIRSLQRCQNDRCAYYWPEDVWRAPERPRPSPRERRAYAWRRLRQERARAVGEAAESDKSVSGAQRP